MGVYGSVHGSGTEEWAPAWAMFSGGTRPRGGGWIWTSETWWTRTESGSPPRMFANCVGRGQRICSPATIERGEFAVEVSNWQVSGNEARLSVAGPGSRRIEDDAVDVIYTGTWTEERGNYSGGSIRRATGNGSRVRCSYTASATHTLLLGSRYTINGGQITVQVDGNTLPVLDLKRSLEDVLIRLSAGAAFRGHSHSRRFTHQRADRERSLFRLSSKSRFPLHNCQCSRQIRNLTLATDWDTLHSIAIAPERTAWLIDTLGFTGRANHYAGAMWFYELCNPQNRYASATIRFSGAPEFGGWTKIKIGETEIAHLNYITDTAETIAKAFELLLTAGTSAVWARADGPP